MRVRRSARVGNPRYISEHGMGIFGVVMDASQNTYDVVLYNSVARFGQDFTEHLGLAYLAASLRERGFRVKFFDSLMERCSPQEGVEKLKEWDFKVLGISFLSYGWSQTRELVRLVREQGMACHICLGGHFASFAYPHLVRDFPQVDSILIGEAEHALPLLVERVLEHRPFDDVPGLVDVGQ
jgi:radical SAM superfamily enzyme YgiQ (UPF0313 family)